MKKLIAYSSIAHVSLIMCLVVISDYHATVSAILLLIAHALPSAGLFFCIGILYDRYHTRIIRYYRGLSQVMAGFTLIIGLFLLANANFPGTINFIGELLMLSTTTLSTHKNLAVAIAINGFFVATYCVWLFQRIYGNNAGTIIKYAPMVKKEILLTSLIILLVVAFGNRSGLLGDLSLL